MKIKLTRKYKFYLDSRRENRKEFIKISRLILKSKQRFRCKKHNVTTAEVNKITLTDNDDKIIHSMDLIESYAYGTNEEIINKKGKKLNVTIYI